MIIRNEEPSDIGEITKVTRAAYDEHSSNQQTETFIISDLRAAGALILSLVTEIDNQIVGHIAFSPVTISDGTQNWYGLGPVSVLPDFQGRRIGTAMVRHGLDFLKSIAGKGCALAGLPTYYDRFGFKNDPHLIHKGSPREVLVAKPFAGRVPSGTVEFHQAFNQLSLIEKDAVSDVIVDYDMAGVKIDPEDPAVERLIEKGILIGMPDGRVMLKPSALETYDPYFAQVGHFRLNEMSRVHKNPLLASVTHGR